MQNRQHLVVDQTVGGEKAGEHVRVVATQTFSSFYDEPSHGTLIMVLML